MRQQNNRNKKFNKKAKPIFIALPFTLPVDDDFGNSYDIQSCMDIVRELQDHDIFTKLTVNVSIDRSIAGGDSSEKGRLLTVGRVHSIDTNNMTANIMLFVKNSELANIISASTHMLIPHVRGVNRETGVVSNISRFEIIQVADTDDVNINEDEE